MQNKNLSNQALHGTIKCVVKQLQSDSLIISLSGVITTREFLKTMSITVSIWNGCSYIARNMH